MRRQTEYCNAAQETGTMSMETEASLFCMPLYFFIILHNNLLLNENEFAIRDWYLITLQQYFMIFFFLVTNAAAI